MMNSDVLVAASSIAALAGVTAAAFFLFHRRFSTDGATGSKSKETTDADSLASPLELQDVWKERRRRGIEIHTTKTRSSKESNAGEEKPFGSTYYYAHNNFESKGGYKDGLRMEDYTMNQPRLLSRGGKPIASCTSDDIPEAENSIHNPSIVPEKSPTAVAGTAKRCLMVTKYLWDDPGNSDGVACIRIDELPSAKSSNTSKIAWKDTSVSDVKASLDSSENGASSCVGLTVTITTDEVDYRLHIH